MIKNLPKKIYLNIDSDEECDFNELHEVTWSDEPIGENDVEYDIYTLRTEIEKLRDEKKNGLNLWKNYRAEKVDDFNDNENLLLDEYIKSLAGTTSRLTKILGDTE